jgi:hypothetical protein
VYSIESGTATKQHQLDSITNNNKKIDKGAGIRHRVENLLLPSFCPLCSPISFYKTSQAILYIFLQPFVTPKVAPFLSELGVCLQLEQRISYLINNRDSRRNDPTTHFIMLISEASTFGDSGFETILLFWI